jgi:hypothetical protein
MTKVAPRFGLSDVGLAKVCKRYDIPRPPVGYWAQKHVGKEPDRTPLPPAEDEARDSIEFSTEEKIKPTPSLTAADRVRDEQLKKLVAFEEQPENQIIVSENPSKYHPFVRDTKAALNERHTNRQGLHSPRWTANDARLDIQVAKASLPRALRIMDAFIKAFEQRGYKVAIEANEYRKDVFVVILGEQFGIRLREKTKMVRIPEAERKSLYDSKVNYEPTGLFELQLRRRQAGFAEMTWKDGKRTKLEEQLNDVMIGLIVAVEKERDWRRQQEEYERQRRENEAKRWQQEQERRKEEQKINELNQMVLNWDQATRIRAFIADVRDRRSPIEGSDLAHWMDWALKHADKINPLGSQHREQSENESSRPSKPR